ncbi:hypothetical protein [Pseudomonas sp. SR18]|uniref:hypothetical protein n=1 Tax=Pseudomonas sp. SR18 TaxID=1461074 RepID=UPI00203394BF|nr:hypothetical protein [Pseudomonas sp. SR18]MCM2361536.1 hypothetical protein [Pseudomonas sp. SR18]
MTEIKERPILFSAPMVRAILEGRKMVTRRAIKVQPHIDASGNFCVGSSNYGQDGYGKPVTKHFIRGCCPYGKPGDRLWVRETWARIRVAQAPEQEWVVFRESDNRTDYGGPWKPGIHMFRRDSRILLDITEVRVERLQDISRADIRAEGLQCPPEMASDDASPNYRDWLPTAWQELWESINGAGSWTANPWVWCVSFKRVTP